MMARLMEYELWWPDSWTS